MTTPQPRQPVTGRRRMAVLRADRAIRWLSRHWLGFFNTLVAIYVGLPLLAPALMNAGYTGPARAIYFVYSPMCHQMASRSFFLFGDQYAYPRELAGTSLTPIEAYTGAIPEFAGVAAGDWANFTTAARRFLGNERMGYKTALCERDMGIYAFVLIGGLLYALLRRRVKVPPLSIFNFILVGMVPIGLDGFSQLFGYLAVPPGGGEPAAWQQWLNQIFVLRESTPFLRTFTGALFGLMLAWVTYPRIDEGMEETYVEVDRKLRRAEGRD